MNKIFKTSLLLACTLLLLAACSDDNDSNPALQGPYELTLYTPQLAESNIDLALSDQIDLQCTYPNYGFPAQVNYAVEVSTEADMSNATEVTSVQEPNISVSASAIAIALTTQLMDQGKQEEDFPFEIPVYMRVVARILTADGLTRVESSRVVSNVVTLKHVKLAFSLPPVLPPTEMYIVGSFCSNNWDKALSMVPVHSNDDLLWHMVYIDEEGIKINETQTDDGALGFDDVIIVGDLAEDIVSKDGRIASSNPGWYLVVLKTTVVGRDRIYELEMRRPEVWLMGTVTPLANWSELEDGCMFAIEGEGADAQFVSPPFANESASDSGVRAYVKVADDIEWWKSEFRVVDNTIDYRGAGDDQDRIMGKPGERMYLKFTTEEGSIK